MKNCVFCKIANHESPAFILFEDDDIMAFMDIDPITDGHVLIIPKEDVKDIYELSYDLGAKIMQASKRIASILKEEFNYESVSIMETNGLFQDVPHFHMHVYGRNKDKDIKFIYPEGVAKSKEHISKVAEKLKKHLFK